MNPYPKNYRMLPSKPWLVLATGIFCGAAVWCLSVPLTGMREPFDSANLYYPIAMFLAGIFATLPAPRCWWMAVLGIFLGERLYAFILLPETRAWLLFGIVVNILIFSWLPAALGAVSVYFVNHQFEKRARPHSHNH
jgi:hypothetical protein